MSSHNQLLNNTYSTTLLKLINSTGLPSVLKYEEVMQVTGSDGRSKKGQHTVQTTDFDLFSFPSHYTLILQ